MSGYTKLFGSILRSSVWLTPAHVRLVWITMLALADRDGVVESSVPGLAAAAGVERTQCEQALALFLSPDPDSRTPDYEGRRIEAVDGGWRLLNHGKYADKLSLSDRREKDAERQRRSRARRASRDSHAASRDVTPVTPSHAGHTMHTQTHTQTDGEQPPPPEPDDVTVRDMVTRRWAVTYEHHRRTAPARDHSSAREVTAWLLANATNTGRAPEALLDALLDAYWREPWPLDRSNRPSMRNLLGQLDRLLVAESAPKVAAVPVVDIEAERERVRLANEARRKAREVG